jgi:hypothetical protein
MWYNLIVYYFIRWKEMIVEFKRPNLDELDIQRLKQNIYSVVDYVKDYITKNPTLSKEQLLINLENEFVNNANEYYFIIQELAGTNVQAIVTDYLLKNEDILKTKYKKLMRKKIVEDKNAIYTYDIEKSSKILIKSLLSLIRENLQKDIDILLEARYTKFRKIGEYNE